MCVRSRPRPTTTAPRPLRPPPYSGSQASINMGVGSCIPVRTYGPGGCWWRAWRVSHARPSWQHRAPSSGSSQLLRRVYGRLCRRIWVNSRPNAPPRPAYNDRLFRSPPVPPPYSGSSASIRVCVLIRIATKRATQAVCTRISGIQYGTLPNPNEKMPK